MKDIRGRLATGIALEAPQHLFNPAMNDIWLAIRSRIATLNLNESTRQLQAVNNWRTL